VTHFNHLHGIFCNRTPNLGAIRAIGYDMDYTLVHYRMEVWENCAYGYMKERLQDEGWPLDELTFNYKDLYQRLRRAADEARGDLREKIDFGIDIHHSTPDRNGSFAITRAYLPR
jgi:5'-nucleotidase